MKITDASDPAEIRRGTGTCISYGDGMEYTPIAKMILYGLILLLMVLCGLMSLLLFVTTL